MAKNDDDDLDDFADELGATVTRETLEATPPRTLSFLRAIGTIRRAGP